MAILGLDALGKSALGEIPGGWNAGKFTTAGVDATFSISQLSTVGTPFSVTGIDISFDYSASSDSGVYTITGFANFNTKISRALPVGRDRHVRRSGDDYAVSFYNLLPQGLAWPRSSQSVLGKLVNGLSQIFGFADGRAADLLEIETDPRETNEKLEDWERAWALPDDCIPFSFKSFEDRRQTLVTKMTLLGAQSRDFFKNQGTLLGESVKIREFAPYMCGVSRTGDTRTILYSDDPINFRWQLGEHSIRYHWITSIEHVLSGVECVFNRYRPAHTNLIITYSSVLDRSMSTYYFLGF
jgi:uncharacterized protein YmfQ (DUF2313 family)